MARPWPAFSLLGRVLAHGIHAGDAEPFALIAIERTGPHATPLFQRQKHFHDHFMRRHLRNEGKPASAIDGEVTCFLPAGRKPIAIKVECGGLQVVGVADDAQRPPGISPDLICSRFASIGWSVPTQRSTL